MYDLNIINANIIDPERGKITVGNICIKNGIISEITREVKESNTVIDASNKFVSPGFIDIHAHIEGNISAGNMICRQGVTTVVNGNCGMGPDDPVSFMKDQNKKGFIINQVELAGATILRSIAGAADPLAPMNAGQLAAANSLLAERLQNGCAGLSFGLEYVPGSSKDEVLTLSRTAARYGKPVAIHTRSDNYSGLASLEEAINICKTTGASVQISHVVYQFGFGMMRQALDIINDAVSQGYDISCDSGMYTSFATYIGTEVFAPSCFQKWNRSYDSIFMSTGKYQGQYLTEESYSDARKNHPEDVAIAVIGVPHEIDMAFDLPYMMVSSDAGVNSSGDTSLCHPQDAGTFPRFLRRLVRDSNRLTLVDAIRRITILPAKRMNLDTKGRISPGASADLVIFDIEKLKDNSLFPYEGKSDTPPDGIGSVIVAGKIAINNNEIICKNAGEAIFSLANIWKY
jgi:N-acyl-D-amino-acid deacylase